MFLLFVNFYHNNAPNFIPLVKQQSIHEFPIYQIRTKFQSTHYNDKLLKKTVEKLSPHGMGCDLY